MDQASPSDVGFLPTNKLIELQFSQSRVRSAKRHNRHVLRAQRRHRRRKADQVWVFKVLIPLTGVAATFAVLVCLRGIFG